MSGEPHVENVPGNQPGDEADRDFELANEFATVRIRRLSTRNGTRLEISSPKLGTTIRLDPLALEALTWQTMDTFSTLLKRPFGPEDP
jgi:hypothetical protein